MSTTYTLRMNENDKSLIREFASMNGMSMSEFMISSAMERIEDAVDLRAWRKAKAEFEADPATYTLDEVEKKLGLA